MESRSVPPGPKGGRRPDGGQEFEAGGPGTLHLARLNLGGTGFSAAAPAHPQLHSTPVALDPDFRASKPRRLRPLHLRPHSHGCSPVPSGSGRERRRRVRRALTGESHGRQCPDLPRLQPESHPASPKHQSEAAAPERRAPEAANHYGALASRAEAPLSAHPSARGVTSARVSTCFPDVRRHLLSLYGK